MQLAFETDRVDQPNIRRPERQDLLQPTIHGATPVLGRNDFDPKYRRRRGDLLFRCWMSKRADVGNHISSGAQPEGKRHQDLQAPVLSPLMKMSGKCTLKGAVRVGADMPPDTAPVLKLPLGISA